MKFSSIACNAILLLATATFQCTNAFVPSATSPTTFTNSHVSSSKSTTSLNAIGVLARKAKEMEVQKFLNSDDVDPEILTKYQQIQDAAESPSSSSSSSEITAFQQALTKRKGTITVIAEYKRRQDKGGFIDEIYDPEILSPTFREFGATAVAVMADERMGGCTYKDIELIKKEQKIAIGNMPGPLFLVSNDLIVHPVQLAQSSHAGADAVVMSTKILGDKLESMLASARVLGLDVIVNVDTMEEAQVAVDLGATILMIPVSSAMEEFSPTQRGEELEGLNVPDGTKICRIANIVTRDDKGLQEVEDAWICRDKGFQAVWASDFLYKSGNDAFEHPGAIIQTMKAKSSVKWASAKARGGKGEGAREYLGDILM